MRTLLLLTMAGLMAAPASPALADQDQPQRSMQRMQEQQQRAQERMQ